MCEVELMFTKAISTDPSSMLERSNYADWLEKINDWRAAGYRWMVDNDKRPCVDIRWRTGNFTWHNQSSAAEHRWSHRETGMYVEIVRQFILPIEIWREVVIINLDRGVSSFTGSDTLQKAEEAVCTVIYEHPECLYLGE